MTSSMPQLPRELWHAIFKEMGRQLRRVYFRDRRNALMASLPTPKTEVVRRYLATMDIDIDLFLGSWNLVVLGDPFVGVFHANYWVMFLGLSGDACRTFVRNGPRRLVLTSCSSSIDEHFHTPHPHGIWRLPTHIANMISNAVYNWGELMGDELDDE